MHTVIVKYTLAEPRSRAQMMDAFIAAGQSFKSPRGLIRKYFCYDEPGHTGHSVYLWESEAQAKAFFSPHFDAVMQEKFGSIPEYFGLDTLMIVDNEQDKIESFPA